MASKDQAEYVDAIVQVRYAETDQMGFAYYANYFVWFEVGRTNFCRARGFTYADLERDTETFIPVIEARCQYKQRVCYDDELLVRTRVKEFHRLMLTFSYELLDRRTGALHAVGETRHVFTGSDGRPKSLPGKYRTYFE